MVTVDTQAETGVSFPKEQASANLGPPGDSLQRLDHLFARLPDNPVYWLREMEEIDKIGEQVNPEEQSLLAKNLIEGIFAKVQQCEDQVGFIFSLNPAPPPDLPREALLGWMITVENYRESFDLFVRKAVLAATEADKETTQKTLLKFMTSDVAPVPRVIADVIISFPEMASGEMEMRTGKKGEKEFDFWGRTVRIEPPIEGAFKAREILAGWGVLVEDKEGKPLRLVCCHVSEEPEEVIIGRPYSAEEFTRSFYYGAPVSLEDIKAYLDDRESRAQFCQLMEKEYNPSVFPLFARVRLNRMLKGPHGDLIKRIFDRTHLSVFQILEDEDLIKVLQMFDGLIQLEERGLVRIMTEGAFWNGEFSSGFLEEGVSKVTPLQRQFEADIKTLLLEGAGLFENKQAVLTSFDLEIIAYSQQALTAVAQAGVALAEGGADTYLHEMKMPPRFMLELFDFSGRHPEAKRIFQTMFDLVIAIQIAKQEKKAYTGKVAEMKREFYREFNKDDLMERTTPTTLTEREVSRDVSSVFGARRKMREEYGIQPPERPRVLLLGCGNCQRLEGPVLTELRELGLEFADILGVDLGDYSKQIPTQLGIRFKQADFSKGNLSAEEGRFDLVLCPWSAINDIVEKKGLLEAFQVIKGFVNKNAVVVIDVPLALGRNSHLNEIEKQADLQQIWGITSLEFTKQGRKLRSIFDLMHVRELVMHLFNAGFILENLPLEFDQQQKMCSRISQNDLILTRNHEARADEDSFGNPFWQAKGYNRATLVARYVGTEGVTELVGLSPSLLVSRGFAPSTEG